MKSKVTNDTKSNGLNLFSRIKGIVEQGLGQLVINSSSKADAFRVIFNFNLYGC